MTPELVILVEGDCAFVFIAINANLLDCHVEAAMNAIITFFLGYS
jgi:hypothetical protein